MLKIETKPQDDCQLQMVVEVDDARVQDALRSAARRLSHKINLPGFRKGKAPYDVVRRQVGEGALYDEALDELGQQVYKEALDEAHVDAYAPGSLEDVQLRPLVLTYAVPLRPDVELGEYRAVRLDFKPAEVSDQAVEEALEHLREHQALIEPADRPAQMGDVITVDVKGELASPPPPESGEGNDGEKSFLLDDKGVSLLLGPKTDWPAPGIAERLAGIAAGETRVVELTFPEDYQNEDLRGKAARFTVTCSEVKSRIVPEWSDELAQSMGDYASLLDLRVKVRQDLQERANREAEQEYARAVVDRVVEGATVKHPPVLLGAELDEMVDDLDRRLREQGLSLDDYLKIKNQSRDELRTELEPRARERLKRSLVLGKVVDVEHVRVGDTQVDERIQSLSSVWGESAGRVKEILSTERSRRSIELDLLTDNAVARLVAIAKGENPPIEETVQKEAPAPAAG